MKKLPNHLGGHANVTHTDQGSINYLKNKLNIKSAYDIGCGPAGMVDLMNNSGIDCCGVDGDFTLPDHSHVLIHDFCDELPHEPNKVDLCWSVEFLEHVEEEYLDNVFEFFKSADYVFCTASTHEDEGHHHVNCKGEEYWVEVFKKYGFSLMEKETAEIREASTMRREFIQESGRLYKNEKTTQKEIPQRRVRGIRSCH